MHLANQLKSIALPKHNKKKSPRQILPGRFFGPTFKIFLLSADYYPKN